MQTKREVFEELKEALTVVKIHDKDLFMLNNILDKLEDRMGDINERK